MEQMARLFRTTNPVPNITPSWNVLRPLSSGGRGGSMILASPAAMSRLATSIPWTEERQWQSKYSTRMECYAPVPFRFVAGEHVQP
jgi:hypothetical protein